MIMQARNTAQGYTKAPPPKPKRRNLVCPFCAYYNVEGEKTCEMCESSLKDGKTDNIGENKPLSTSRHAKSRSGNSSEGGRTARAAATQEFESRARDPGVIETFKAAFLGLGPTIKHAFDVIDQNGDGRVSRSEFKKVRIICSASVCLTTS